jgi:acyl-coenzyme A thioesterase PaaI-like protein
MKPPKVQPEPDWEEFSLPFDIGSGRSMFVETESGPTIRMRFFKRRPDGMLVGRVWFGGGAFGPPGFVHGGAVAFVLDEAMGACAWLGGYPSVAANLSVDFVELTPLGEDCFVDAKIVQVQPKKLVVEARFVLDDRLLVRGRGIFVRLTKERLISVFRETKRALPDLSGFEFAR